MALEFNQLRPINFNDFAYIFMRPSWSINSHQNSTSWEYSAYTLNKKDLFYALKVKRS